MERNDSVSKERKTQPGVHDVFHILILRKYVSDPSHVLEAPPIEFNEDLSFEVQPMSIVDQGIKELRNKTILMVKVLWRNDTVEEITWETEAFMRSCHPYLFNT